MTVIVANTSNTNTFDYWRNRTNELAYAMTTYAVTAGSSNAAVGNAAITGNFNANTLSVGNSSVNTTIRTANSTQQSNGQYFLNANGSWTLIGAPVYTDNTALTGTSVQLVDYYDMTTYGAVEYLVNVVDNNANNRLATKILTIHDNNTVWTTEYATMTTNTSNMGSFAANANSTHARLYFTPVSSNTNVRFIRFNI
jgi:hypothetical protein